MKRIEYVRNNDLHFYARRCVYILIAMVLYAIPGLMPDGFFQEKIDEINLNIKASALAKEIFTEISKDMDTLMFDLQDEIKKKFTGIVPYQVS